MLRMFRLYRAVLTMCRRPASLGSMSAETKSPARKPGFKPLILWGLYDERRSAVQVPAHSPEPAVHWPEPSVAESLPWPLALWLPRATFTTTLPLSPTLPETVNDALPAYPTVPLSILTG